MYGLAKQVNGKGNDRDKKGEGKTRRPQNFLFAWGKLKGRIQQGG